MKIVLLVVLGLWYLSTERGGVLQAALTGEPDSLDPAKSQIYTGAQVYDNIFSKLIDIDTEHARDRGPDSVLAGVLGPVVVLQRPVGESAEQDARGMKAGALMADGPGCLAVSRQTQGEMLGRKQMVQQMIADSWIQIEQFRLLVLRTAWKIDKHNDYRRVIADISAVTSASLAGVMSRARSRRATWPSACTPASVRPAACIIAASPVAARTASSTACCTLGPWVWRCNPMNGVPSNSRVSAKRVKTDATLPQLPSRAACRQWHDR